MAGCFEDVRKERGGWIHAHENVGVAEMEERRTEVKREFWSLSAEYDPERIGAVQVERVERVEMYAPGVVHAVFDVHIERTKSRLASHQKQFTYKGR